MSKARDLAGLFNLGSRSGTTAQRPATADVGDIYYNGTTGKTEIYTTTGWKEMASGIPFGNNAGRPTGVTGQPYFNGETARLELFTGTSWENIVQEVPGVSSISGNYSEATDSGVITIFGTNFVSGAYATAIGSNGVQINAASTVYNSLVQLTATFTGLSNAQEPYDIKVTNPSNLFGLIPDALYVNASPVWQTASGSLGTFNEQVSISLSATALDSDSTIVYALASGSSLPSGVTLNSSSGLISGTLPDINSDTTYNFTVNASDGLNVIPRSFSITSKLLIPVEYLLVAGGGGGAGGVTGDGSSGGGGAGGLLYGNKTFNFNTSCLITVGTGGSGGLGLGTGGSNYSLRNGTNGNNSVFDNLTSIGGGSGKCQDGTSGNSGGSGGGGAGGGSPLPGAGGAGTSGQGNSGGSGQQSPYGGGGGGGAGSAGGSNGGSGGAGLSYSITGQSLSYAGGGGSGSNNYGVAGGFSGGSGVGGNGATGTGVGGNGAANTGSGGGAGGGNGSPGSGGNAGAGGSGVVILAYPNSNPNITTIPGTLTYTLDTTTRPGYKVYRFTAGTGTVTF
jgi:hypothetical protein